MRDDDDPPNIAELPLPTSPETDLVFLRLILQEMADQAVGVLDGIRAQKALNTLPPWSDVEVPRKERLAERIRWGERACRHLETAVNKAGKYFASLKGRHTGTPQGRKG